MFAASQFASVQYGSITTQVAAGYFIVAIESLNLDDTTKFDATFLQVEPITFSDALTIIGITTSTTERFILIDTGLLITPGEGTQIGDWRRVAKVTGVWTPIPN